MGRLSWSLFLLSLSALARFGNMSVGWKRFAVVWVLPGILGACLGCSERGAGAELQPRPRPVRVFELKVSQPSSELRHAGSVSAWKSQDVGFEVAGRIQYILEPGLNVEGPSFDAATDGFQTDQATVLARVSPTRYEVQLASAEARLETAKAQLSAAEKELRDVMPRRIQSAKAQFNLAQQELRRVQALFERAVETQQRLDVAQADVLTSEAELQQMEATATVRESERASYAAQVNEAREAVRQAQQDLKDTTLFAPFQGQISSVYETVGSVVQAGQGVVRVQMMDPIQVEVQVSAQTDARLNYNDIVSVYPAGESYSVPAMVYEKAAVADAATRTFLVSLLIRNSQLTAGLPEEFDPEKDVRTRSIGALFAERIDQHSPYFVREESLYREGDEFLVWRIRNLQQGMRDAEIPNQLEVEPVKVVPGERRLTFQTAATMRDLIEIGTLNPQRDVLLGQVRNMQGEPLEPAEALARLKSQGKIYFVREQWRFRPGDIVLTDLSSTSIPEGFYVPMDALKRRSLDENLASLFVVRDSERGHVVREIAVRLLGKNVGTSQLLECVTEGELQSGDRIVSAGVHFLVDGEAVRVTGVQP